MNRRSFLKLCAHTGTVGTLLERYGSDDGSLDVRVWLSERAASRGPVAERATGYLDRTLGAVRDDVTVTAGGTVSVSREHGYDVVVSGEWPGKLAVGAADGDVSPVDDVNLLVTDGPMDSAPTGGGRAHIAAVGGARYLAAMPPVSDVSPVVRYSRPARVMQVLLHEAGHALGLTHDQGSVRTHGDAAVATPMIGNYAWTEGYDPSTGACGTVSGLDADRRRLSFLFSECAANAIDAYDGGLSVPSLSDL